MYRSVTQSEESKGLKRSAVYWLQGVGVGIAVFLVVFFIIGWG